MRKPAFCICENKDADQLRGNCEADADQRLCFRYTDSTIPLPLLNLIIQASCNLLWMYSLVCVGPGRKPEDMFRYDEAHLNLIVFFAELIQTERQYCKRLKTLQLVSIKGLNHPV